MNEPNTTTMIELTSEIVAAYVANNHVQVADLPQLITTVRQTFNTLGQAPAAPGPSASEAEPTKPAVPIKKSITDDYLISLFDGRKFKSLKRHLSAEHGMTPDEYRMMFGLPRDYPMVAPAYAKQRSSLAKSLGLGRRAMVPEAEQETAPEPEHIPELEAPQKRSRAKAVG